MKRPTAYQSFPIRTALLLAGLGAVLAASGVVLAHETYSVDGETGNCASCHGDFRQSPYVSLADGQSWGDDLHDVHRRDMLNSDCNACHVSSGRSPTFLAQSAGGTGLDPIGCVGCHGRAEDGTGVGQEGTGAGLRQHHWNAGETSCVACHADSNPANKTVVGENVQPPYYANPGANHPAIPSDPCNPSPGNPEDFAGSSIGQDNDGDGIYDENDPDCATAVCGNGTVEAGEDCDDGNTADGDCCSSTCAFESAGSTCDDGLFCNVGESCDGAGACGGGSARDCADGVGCTADSCDEASDSCQNAANDTACDDGLFCNGFETCDVALDCQAGSAVDCDDGVICTVDSCDETGDLCTNSPDDAACDDGLFCNGAETCDAALDCQAGMTVDCDDTDICTDDSCDETGDVCDNVFDPTNDPQCAALVCGNGTLDAGEDCDDGNTLDGDCCSATCSFEGAGSPCDDGLFCNAGETCDGAGSCGGSGPRDCDDGVSCTADSCDEGADSCVNTADDAVCDDGMFCNGVESCDALLDCQPGTAVDCDDADICTDDSCDETGDVCENVFDVTNDPSCASAVCGNSQLELGEECDDGNTVDGDCCSALCAFESAGSSCDDGLFCNAGETCDGAGACVGGSARDCDDGISCTADSCDEGADSCVQAAADAVCDDGMFCNGVETCDALLDCQAGTAVDCDDADICTDDSCDENGDVCDNTFDPTNDPQCAALVCGNGALDPGEDCDDGNTADGDCCSSTCLFENVGSSCDDGLFCNAGETCDGAGACVGGSTRDCTDGVGCTADSCDENGDSCVHSANDAACDDGLFCNGAETCDVALDCQAGVSVDCGDGDICTDDSCDENGDVCDNVFDPTNDPSCQALLCGNGTLDAGEACDDGNTADGDCCSSTCTFEQAGSACDDGLFCNAGETCDGAGVCTGGGARDCDDGVSCTIDSCDEGSAACLNTPDDAACDDGAFCNGTETCDATLDCRVGTAVDCNDDEICTDDSCDETGDACDNVFDPTNDPQCQAQCQDADSDGFSIAGGDCGPVDCDDGDPAVNPGASEVCGDHLDNNCDTVLDAADEACGFDGAVAVRSGPLQNADYAGSLACAECHVSQFEAWESSLHAKMLVPPGDSQAAGFELPDAGSLPGATVDLDSWADVLFVIGQKWKSRYVSRDGFIQGIQWNYHEGGWNLYNDGEPKPYGCGACHTTGYAADATFVDQGGHEVAGIVGSWVEYNIGCEACHGPGAAHATAPSSDNINQIVLDWSATEEGVRTPSIRSAEVCGNCHYRDPSHFGIVDPRRRHHEQFNDWSASDHASSLQPTGLNTYCAKCHSPGNAEAGATEHNFNQFEPSAATHVTCVACHDPHRVSQDRWAALQWPSGGQQDPRQHQARVDRYRGTDENPFSNDYDAFENENTNDLCTDCHTLQPGFRRHVNATPPAEVTLQPPFNSGQGFEVPHGEHVEQGYAECVDCHMPYTRTSINPGDVRSHSLAPNEWRLGGFVHYDETCGQCHQVAQDCTWCHSDFSSGSAEAAGALMRRVRGSRGDSSGRRGELERPLSERESND